MQERRRAERPRQFLGGRILFNERCSTFDCLVRDMTVHGARLHLPSTTGMPGAFELTVAAKQESHPARVVWRNDTQAGVEFVEKIRR